MQNEQKKKMMLIGGIVAALLILAGIGGGVYMMTQQKEVVAEEPKVEEKKKKKTDQINTIPVSERAYIQLIPSGGRNIILSINELKKPAETVEYELEYQAGELLQGAFGKLELSSLPVTKDILFGSCSAGGACTYHQNIQGGTLVTRFSGTNSYALKSDWRYIENKTRARIAASKDAKFQIDSPEIAKQSIIVIANSPGYPGTPPGTVISEIYSLSSGSPLKGTVNVSIRANEEIANAQIAVWNGTSWKAVGSTVDGKTITADTELAQAYTVIKPE